MASMKKKIAIIIPCYKAKGKVGQFINNLIRVFSQIDHKCNFLIYLVDDYCPLESWREAINLEGVRIIHHSFNRGVGASTMTGFRAALDDDNDFFIKMDADGQHPSEYLLELVPYLLSLSSHKLCIVKGSRFSLHVKKQKVPFLRRFGSFVLEPLARLSLSYKGITDIANGFISFNRITIEYLVSNRFKTQIKNRFLFESSVLTACSNLGADVHEFYMHSVYGSKWTSSMNTIEMIIPILCFWLKSIFSRIFLKYFSSLNFGSLLLISSLLNMLISVFLLLNNILPMIFTNIYVTAGNASGFTTSFLLSIFLFCFFILYDFSNRLPARKIFFRVGARDIYKN